MIPHPDGQTLVLRRVFVASRHRVFRAWLEPAALERWLRPRGKRVMVRSLDARVGGSFRFDIADGGFITGIYREINPPERLVFTWSGPANQNRESMVTLEFLDQGAMTEMVLTHDGLSALDLILVSGGWPSMLDALSEVLHSSSGDAESIIA